MPERTGPGTRADFSVPQHEHDAVDPRMIEAIGIWGAVLGERAQSLVGRESDR